MGRDLDLIKPLALGNKIFPVNIIQGPLAGISCAPFRVLTSRYSQPAFSCTEMISCKTILNSSYKQLERYIYKDPNEGPVCFQLSGSDPYEIGEAVKKVTDFGADLIDLNCGCPVKKIRSKGAGSSLLANSAKLYQLITALKNNTTVPVSIKIRVDANSDDKCNQEVAQVVSEAGADFLVVHGRHWTEHYETPCRYDEIQFFVNELKIPVIGNGDVSDVLTLRKMLETGCAGVMISRAGVGRPWLIGKLMAQMKEEKFAEPGVHAIKEMLIEHVEGLHHLLGSEKLAMLQMRKFAKYYVRNWENKREICEAVNRCESLAEFRKLINAA
jgi:tRNA-dihydrouridine synthase B